jgi:hypothetical protein
MADQEIRAALERHWAASDANDFATEHRIYREDAVLDYPQSGERIRGRQKIQASRTAQPNRERFAVRRIVGAGELWVTEYVITYDGVPSYTGEHHGVPRRPGSARDTIFRGSLRAGAVARAMGRTAAVTVPSRHDETRDRREKADAVSFAVIHPRLRPAS